LTSLALAVPDERALAVRDNVAFFQTVRAALIKSTVRVNERQKTLTRPFAKSSRARLPQIE
jgi:hypothetical protein